MMNILRSLRLGAVIVGMAALLAATSAPVHAQQTGAVRLTITKAGFIVGVGGGSGVLRFKGKDYRLRVGGISAGTIGVASADLVGTASNLRTAADIAGTYTAVGASVAVAGGAKTARLQNSNGVILVLRGAQVGLELSLNLSGVTISLE